MPVWSKHKSLLLVLFITLFAGAASSRLYAAEIKVNHVGSDIINDIYVVNANLTYELGDSTKEALDNGIPLIFYIEVEFEQSRDFMWNKQLLRHYHEMQLEHHPLSEQYVLTNLATSDQFSFNSLNDALFKLGQISKLPVAETKQIETSNMILGRIRSGIDIESLPAPMRLEAWLSSEWRISSDWVEWEIKP